MIHGASGLGAVEDFKEKSLTKIDSSTLGIMLGGLTNGKENDGRVCKNVGACGIVNLISGKYEHSLVLRGNGYSCIGCFFTKNSLY